VSDSVIIRRFRAHEFDRVVQGRSHLQKEALGGGVLDPEKLRNRIRRSGIVEDGRVDLALEVEGKLVGEIQTYVPTDRHLPPATYELGVALYEPQDRRRGFGTQAVRLLVGWLFGIGADRVQGAAALTNVPMRRGFQKLSFKGNWQDLRLRASLRSCTGSRSRAWERSTPAY